MDNIPTHAKKAFSGELFTVWQWEQELFDGSTATFEAVTRPHTAFAIGALPQEKVLMVRDYQPHREAVIGSPGGRIEEGEEPKAAAVRELREETGFEPGKVDFWFDRAWGTKIMHTDSYFIAKDLKQVGPPENSPGEKIELLELNFDDFLALGRNKELREVTLRLKLMEAELDKHKREELYSLLYG